MKWNTPVVAELDVRMTENGRYEACKEGQFLWDDHVFDVRPSDS